MVWEDAVEKYIEEKVDQRANAIRELIIRKKIYERRRNLGMRKRFEIEKEITNITSGHNQKLMIELLLDIRER